MTEFGTKIPDLKDIVKINGKNLVDKNGNEIDRKLVEINHDLGGGFELVKNEDDDTV